MTVCPRRLDEDVGSKLDRRHVETGKKANRLGHHVLNTRLARPRLHYDGFPHDARDILHGPVLHGDPRRDGLVVPGCGNVDDPS